VAEISALTDFIKASLMLWEDDTKLEELFWNKAKQLICSNPNLAAQKLKIPFLADPDFIKN
jgi:hypothetical protein